MKQIAMLFDTAKAKFLANLMQLDTCCNPWCVFKLSDNYMYNSCNMDAESTQKNWFQAAAFM